MKISKILLILFFFGIFNIPLMADNSSKIYDIENFSVSYSYNEVFSRNINTEYSIRQDYSGGLGYNFNTTPKNIKPLKRKISQIS